MKSRVLGKRIGAMTIDWMIASFIHTGLLILILRFGYLSELFPKIIMLPTNAHSILYFSLVTTYYIISEGIWGRTIGKKVFNLTVINDDGGKPSFASILVRNMFRITDQFLLVGSITIFSDKSDKRLGDKVGRTIVIEKKEFSTINHQSDE